MTPTRRTYTFRIDDAMREGLQIIQQRDGIPVSEQIRRAIHEWLAKKCTEKKSAPRRVQPRRKA